MPYEKELLTALRAASAAGEVLLRHFSDGSKTWDKADKSPVTEADLEADRVINEAISSSFPDDVILSEETVSDRARTARPRVWIVDPMDGTKEFVARIPEFAASIALAEHGDPVVGVIVNPAEGRAVWATSHGGAFTAPWPATSEEELLERAEPARTTETTSLEDAVVIASRTEISHGSFAPYDHWFKELRPVGSIAWKLACIACGDADLNVSVAPKNEWDVCAGDLVVREAGGTYVDFHGFKRIYNQPETLIEVGMAAGGRALVEAFCARARAQ